MSFSSCSPYDDWQYEMFLVRWLHKNGSHASRQQWAPTHQIESPFFSPISLQPLFLSMKIHWNRVNSNLTLKANRAKQKQQIKNRLGIVSNRYCTVKINRTNNNNNKHRPPTGSKQSTNHDAIDNDKDFYHLKVFTFHLLESNLHILKQLTRWWLFCLVVCWWMGTGNAIQTDQHNVWMIYLANARSAFALKHFSKLDEHCFGYSFGSWQWIMV